jgi:hypothetical protein
MVKDGLNDSSNTFKLSSSGLIAIALIGANVGISEYLSISFFAVLSLVVLLIRKNKSLNPRKYIIYILFILSVAILYGIYLPHTGFFGDLQHSVLSHLRESVMLLFVILACETTDNNIKDFCRGGFGIAAILIASLVCIQYIQLSIGIAPIALPPEYFMINYSNTLLNAFRGEAVYVRPSALYSEPSVVAAILVPSLYIFLSSAKIYLTILIGVAILLCGSVYGLAAAMVVVIFRFVRIENLRNLIGVIFMVSLVMMSILYAGDLILSERITGILHGEDDSFNWRFNLPYDYLKYRWMSDETGPSHVQELMKLSEDLYQASIFDTWPMYTLAKFGITIGIIWIVFVLFVMPKKVFWLFLFFALVSGAPLYHDKVLMLMVFGLAMIPPSPYQKEPL